MSSPENLGKVVDIQLREQIALYQDLLEKCHQIEREKSGLNEQIDEHIQKINALESKCLRIESENSEHVKRYEDKLEELAALSKESETNLNEFQSLRIEFDMLIVKVNESQQTIEDLNSAKSQLQDEITMSNEREVILQSEIDRLTRLLEDLQSEVERLKGDKQSLSESYTVSLNEKDIAFKQLEQDRNERIVELEQQVKFVR